MIITSQHVHSRNWMQCPMCEGGKLFTAKDRKQGAICCTCENKGEIPIRNNKKIVDNSSYYERLAGA